jgi:hypothetical protein
LNGQSLTFNRQYSVILVKDFPILRLHIELGCRNPPEGLPLNFQKLVDPALTIPLFLSLTRHESCTETLATPSSSRAR